MTERAEPRDEADRSPAQTDRAGMPIAIRAVLLLCMAAAFAMPAGPRAAHDALYRDGGALLGVAADGVLLTSIAILVATTVQMTLRLIQSGLDPLWERVDAGRPVDDPTA